MGSPIVPTTTTWSGPSASIVGSNGGLQARARAGATRQRSTVATVLMAATRTPLGSPPGQRIGVASTRVDRGPALARGQLGERLLVEDLEHRVAHVDHHVAEGAGRLVRTRARLVVAQRDAGEGSQRPVQ